MLKQDNNTNFSWVDFHDNDDDEALSFCDRNETGQELFEFFSDFNSGMRAAEDIIYCGKLLPYSSPESKNQSNQPRVSNLDEFELEEERLIEADSIKKRLFPHRSFPSFNELQKSQPRYKNGTLDNYHKLQRTWSSKNTSPTTTTSRAWKEENIVDRNKCFRKKQVVLFGVVKAPAEMELQDIKYRQSKRNSLASSVVHPGEKTRKSPWSVLGALSCNGHANTGVITSLRCLPRV